ncbi:hypothetical protein [Solimonas terrae]|uniref:Uncharacterized protein n=1 Tax=Solimonas terrae TaxID=1396819 RepID=A0A6M2BQ97_9GAMM|nr:hypothetical protein [Solimonas terrae]NGY04391.1 hypothetical protein [Solimonas terrae]
MTDVLVMPRHLAIRILHEAQIAQPESIRGVVAARAGEPAAFLKNRDAVADGDALWANLWSHPQAEAIPLTSELRDGLLSLVVSLNTKGVLEMRAWRLIAGTAQEQVLKIRD